MANVYDRVITTQAEFDAMLNEGNWGGIKSVLFAGEFTHTGHIYIPSNVKTVVGVNGAKITLTGTDITFMGYATMPTSDDYSITGLHVVVDIPSTNESGSAEGFRNCRNLINCISESTNGRQNGGATGFMVCVNLVNCKAKTYSPANTSTGYQQCENLVGCSVEALSGIENTTLYGYGFHSCRHASNCTGTSTAELWHFCSDVDPYSCDGAPSGVLYISNQTDFNYYLVDGNWKTGIREIVLAGSFTATQGISIPYHIQKIRGLGFTQITFNVSSDINCFKYASTSTGPYSFENINILVNATRNESGAIKVIGLYGIHSVKDVKIHIILKRTYEGTVGQTEAYGFYSCFDMVNCESTTYVENNVVANSSGKIKTMAYYSCIGVVGCKGTASGKYAASSGSSSMEIHGFGYCSAVVTSRGSSTRYESTSESVTSIGYVFYGCDGMAGCYPLTPSETNQYSGCTNVAGCIGYTA